VLEPVRAHRVLTTPAAATGLSARPDDAAGPMANPAGSDRAGPVALTIAPDEILFIDDATGDLPPVTRHDPHALVVEDRGWMAAWLDAATIENLVEAHCRWALPTERPALAQGLMAEVPVKLWLEPERGLLVVAHTMAQDLAQRIGIDHDPGGAHR
jgi:hypothetical protein